MHLTEGLNSPIKAQYRKTSKNAPIVLLFTSTALERVILKPNSFNAYVNHSRLSHACYLMENSDMPIIQCAYDSGFTSLRSFNRNFKAYYKVTPAEYRKI